MACLKDRHILWGSGSHGGMRAIRNAGKEGHGNVRQAGFSPGAQTTAPTGRWSMLIARVKYSICFDIATRYKAAAQSGVKSQLGAYVP